MVFCSAFGFLASWLWLFGFLAFGLFRLLVALAFRILCFHSSSLGFLAFAPFHWFLDLASRIVSFTSSALFESTLLRTSWGGLPPPPTPPLLFRFLAEIELHPCLNHHFSERPISRENAAKYDILGNLCNSCISVCMHFFEHHRGSHPRQPSHCPLLPTSWGAASPPQPFRYVLDFLQRLNCTPS